MIHHCIGPNPDHGVYRGMSEAVRVASTFLTDPSTAPEEIDVHLFGNSDNVRELLWLVSSSRSLCIYSYHLTWSTNL